jgi:molybdopterin converting factor small subunit
MVRESAEGTTVQKLLEKELGGPPGEVKTVFVNGASRSFDHVLADGDRVGIFPPVGGG